MTTTQLAAEGGATLVIAALRRALGARPIQEAVRLFRQLIGLRDLKRQSGESMRKWISRFEAFIKKTGKALHQADAEIDEATYLHPLIQGILLLECSNLSPSENAAVLATSGATSKEGGSIGNSYLYVDLAASFIAQWDDEALARRDKAPQKRSHHTAAAATTTWDLSSPSSSFLEPDTMDGDDFEMTLGTCDEPWEDQSWEEPEEAEFPDDDWTDEISPDDPELEEQFGSLEAAEAYAVTEFKNASSDMKNATRTFMEAKDLVSRVKHARGYFPVVGVGAFDGFQTITPRGSRQTGAGKGTGTGMNSQTGKGHGRVFRKGKPPRDPRRRSPAKSRVTLTGSTKGGPAHGTRLQPGQCLLRRQTGHLAKDCPNRETRDDSGINHKRAFGSFVGMTAEVSSRIFTRSVITTNQQQEVRRTPVFTMSHVPVAIWLSLVFILERIFFHWLPWPAQSKTKRCCSVGTQTEPETAPTSSPTQQQTSHTVMVSKKGVQSTMIHRSSTVCSPSTGIFAEWAAFAVEDVKGYALLDTGASRLVGGYMMVQYVIDCLSENAESPWLESADPAVSFTFAGGEKAHSETPDLAASSRDEAGTLCSTRRPQ